MKLYGKYKNGEWEKFDSTNPDSDYSEKEQMEYLENEYRLVSEQGWMFKWMKN